MNNEEINERIKKAEKIIRRNNILYSNLATVCAIGIPTTVKSIELNNDMIQILGIATSLVIGTTTGIIINKLSDSDKKEKVKRK